MIVSLANVIAGLGLFFAGIWFLSENLKRATSRRFRQGVIAWTRTPSMGFSVGAIAGALTQSISVTVFILVSLMRAGLIGVRNALPLIAGAYLGMSVLVFMATLETQVVMLFVIGFVGFIIGLDLVERFRPLIGALFGLSMLFLGIDLIQSGAVPLLEHEWAEGVMTWARKSYLTSFLAGAILTCVSQSSAAVTILAITLADAGVFDVEQTIMIIYGTSLGSSAITAALSWNLRGRSLQIAMFQILFNVVSCAILVPLFYLEVYGGVPLVKSLVVWLTPQTDVQLAWVYLIFGLPGAITLLPALNPVASLLERMFRPTTVEGFSEPRFIYDAAVSDPETAMDLVHRELRRELDSLSTFLDSLKPDAPGGGGSLTDHHTAYSMLSNRVMEFIDGMGRKAPSFANYDRINELFSHQRLMDSVESTLFELSKAIQSIEHRSSLRPLAGHVVEALGCVVRDANEAAHGKLEVRRRNDIAMDSGTAEVLREMRLALMSHDGSLNNVERSQFFRIIHLSERFFWLLSHIPLDEFARLDNG